MSVIDVKIDSLKDYSSKLTEGYNKLIAIMSRIDKLNKDNQEMGNSKTINLFKNVFNEEVEKETNSLINDRDSLDNIFAKEIIPTYENLFNKNSESVN